MTPRHEPGRRPDRRRGGSGLRRAAWVLLFAVAGLALGGLGAARLGSGPVGQAVVLVPPLPGNAFSVRSGDTLVDLKTESQLPFSDLVLARVATTGPVEADVLRRRLSVRLVDHAEVVVVSYRGGTSAASVGMVTRVAEAMLAVRAERAAGAYAARAAVLEAALATAEKGLVAQASAEDAEAVAVLGQRIVTLRGELRSVTGNEPIAGTVLASSVSRAPSVATMRIAVMASCAFLAGVVGYWFVGRMSRGRGRFSSRRPRRPTPTDRDLVGSVRAW